MAASVYKGSRPSECSQRILEMAQAGECPVGASVRVAAGDGIVRWTGTNPDFAAGKWVGIELYVSSWTLDAASVSILTAS